MADLYKYIKLINEKLPKPPKPPKTYESTQHYKFLRQIHNNPSFLMPDLPKGWVTFT